MSFDFLGVPMLLNTLFYFVKQNKQFSDVLLPDIRYLQRMNNLLYTICSKIFYYKY